MPSVNPTRRELLVRWLPAGVVAFWQWGANPMAVLAMGAQSLPDGVHRAEGDVRVNDKSVRAGAPVASGDTVSTGNASHAVVVLNRAVYLIREQTRLTVTVNSRGSKVRAAIRVFSGRLLSVFGGGLNQISTQTAVIGIRGSGLYVAVEPRRTYACTCYGKALIQTADDADISERVQTRHHEAPRYIYGPSSPVRITPAPVVDHTDAELIMLEAVVGRKPPFVGAANPYKY